MSISDIYQQYQNFLRDNQAMPDKANGLECHARIRKPRWQADVQIDCFPSGVLLSRQQARGEGLQQSMTAHFSHNFALFAMLDGCNQVLLPGGRELLVRAGDVWLVQGEMENVREVREPVRGRLASLHLDFSRERLRRWQDEGLLPAAWRCGQDAGTHMRQLGRLDSATSLLVRQVLQWSCAGDALARLELESATLALTARLLRVSMQGNGGRQRQRIDDAVDIVRAEFAQPLTIAGLARRVGMNECYLKRFFRERTGETVAAYIRRLRLECAMALLAEGRPPHEVRRVVGYRHAGHFNALFQARYGCLPPEVGKGE